jgi:hypothetical protein
VTQGNTEMFLIILNIRRMTKESVSALPCRVLGLWCTGMPTGGRGRSTPLSPTFVCAITLVKRNTGVRPLKGVVECEPTAAISSRQASIRRSLRRLHAANDVDWTPYPLVDDEKHLVPVITLPLVDNENPFRTLPPGEFCGAKMQITVE